MTAVIGLEDLPSGEVVPEGVAVPREVRRARAALARREFVRLVSAAAVGTGLAFAGLFPTARKAYATHLTPSTTSAGCYGGRTNQSLVGTTGCCACGSSVKKANCNSEGWHRHHRHDTGRTTYDRHKLRLTSCRGKTASGVTVADGKNSWLWNRGGTVWRCSDGQTKHCTSSGCGAWHKTVCPAKQVATPPTPTPAAAPTPPAR